MPDPELIERELSNAIIGAFFDSYHKLGFGFLESIYSRALEKELKFRGLTVAREAVVQVQYDGEMIGHYRADLIVERRVLIELKATERLPPWSKRQVLNYLRCTGLKLGLVLHYGPEPKFHRVVWSPRRSASLER